MLSVYTETQQMLQQRLNSCKWRHPLTSTNNYVMATECRQVLQPKVISGHLNAMSCQKLLHLNSNFFSPGGAVLNEMRENKKRRQPSSWCQNKLTALNEKQWDPPFTCFTTPSSPFACLKRCFIF